jgi:hypothetical protein
LSSWSWKELRLNKLELKPEAEEWEKLDLDKIEKLKPKKIENWGWSWGRWRRRTN